jgi:photosystem II stability/assembly factor-like uncharacterized protein
MRKTEMSKIKISALLLAAALGLCAIPAMSVSAMPAMSAMSAAGSGWRPLPIPGGDIRSLAIQPDDPDVVLAGTSAGQLYLSKDGGRSWTDAGVPLPFPGWLVSSLRFDPNRTARLWVSLQGVWGGGHVASSDDLGKTWASRAAGLPEEPVYTLALVPGHEGRLYAGTLSGVWGTEDGGESWRRLTGALPEVQKVTSLLVDPRQPDTVIAGTWRQAYRSADAGQTWAGVFDGMVLDSEVFSLTPIPERPGELWASTCGWVYRSVDFGDHWERFKDGFEERRTPSFSELPDGRLAAGTVAGLHISEDGGQTWKRVGDPALTVLAIATDPRRPRRILLGTEGAGVWASTDGGATFHPSNRGMTNTRVTALAMIGGDLLVGVSNGGPITGIHVSHDRGANFLDFTPLPNVLEIAWQEGRVFAATERGLYERLGAGWQRVDEIGDVRVEQIVGASGQLVVRTADGLWEMRAGRFARRPFQPGVPRSAALFEGALWVSDGKSLYRLGKDEKDGKDAKDTKAGKGVKDAAGQTVAAPFAGGRLQRLQDQLLLWGPGGAFVRASQGEEASWVELTDKSSRLLPTGSSRWPALMISGDTVRIYDREARRFRVVPVPVPARDISSALVADGRLLLGTSGYGVLARELRELMNALPAPPTAAETAAAGSVR